MGARTGSSGPVLGPLTTAWSMPDSCTVHMVICSTCTEGYRGQQCSPTKGVEAAHDHTTCWPPATARAGTPKPAFHGWGFYSPGLACPTGYTTACTAQYDGPSQWEVQFTLVPGETAVGCCPEGFQCTNLEGNSCIAVISTGIQTAVTTGTCSGLEMVSVGLANFPDIITTTITDTAETAGPGIAIQTVTREMTLLAPMFQLNYKSSDLVSESSSTTTTSPQLTSANTTPTAMATATAGSDTTDNTSASDSSSTPVASEQSGLSTGAAAGIGVGAALGAILLAAVLGWLWWKRARRRPAEATWSEAQTLKDETSYSYPFTTPVPGGHGPIEMAGPHYTPVELDGPRHAPLELDGNTAAELSGEGGRCGYY